MGFKTKITFLFATLATLSLAAAMCSPWWFTKTEPETDLERELGTGSKLSLFFIDGTCRNSDGASKNNGDAQVIYDLTMTLMILAWLPLLMFVHVILFRWSDKYENFTSKKWIVGTGIFTFILVLLAVLLFGTQVWDRYGYYNLYGSKDTLLPMRRKTTWGAHVGWYFAMISILLLLPAIITGCLMKNKRGGAEREVLITSERRNVQVPIRSQ